LGFEDEVLPFALGGEALGGETGGEGWAVLLARDEVVEVLIAEGEGCAEAGFGGGYLVEFDDFLLDEEVVLVKHLPYLEAMYEVVGGDEEGSGFGGWDESCVLFGLDAAEFGEGAVVAGVLGEELVEELGVDVGGEGEEDDQAFVYADIVMQ